MSNLISEDAIEQLRVDGFFVMRLAMPGREAVAAALDAAYTFFRTPDAEKRWNHLPEGCGYRPSGIEYSKSPDILDPMESFTASVRTEASASALPSAGARLLHKRAIAVMHVLEPIAEAFATQLARASSGGAARPDLQAAFHRWSYVQFNYSKPSSTPDEFINDVHEDGTLVTVGCATAPGLEIRATTGSFVPATTLPPDVLVMPGEIASLLSGGYVQPLYHRVHRDAEYPERLALLFNGDIDPRLCTPWVSNEINANVDIGSRVLTNSHRFGLPGFSLE